MDLDLEEADILMQPVAERTKGSSQKFLDDLIQLRGYTGLILIMAELAAFTCLSSITLMVFVGASPVVVSCDSEVFDSPICSELAARRNATGCTPQLEHQFLSLQVEFDYVCGEAKKVKLTTTWQMFGVLLGAAFFGHYSDSHGRRPVLLITSAGNALFNVVASQASDLFMFTVWRSIAGFFTGGLSVVQLVFIAENMPRRHRMWIQNAITWSPNQIIYPFIAYHAQDWRTLTAVVGIASALCGLATLILEESPRWLIQQGKLEEAKKSLERILRIDGRKDFKELLHEVLVNEKEVLEERGKPQGYSYIHLFCTRTMILRTLTFIFGIICTTVIVYALFYNMETLSGSLYWNTALIGMARWAVNILVSVLDYKFDAVGRKPVNYVSMISTTLFLYGTTVLVALGIGGYFISISAVVTLAMCSQSFIVKYMMVNELYPTAVRNLAVSAVSTCSRIGTMFAPQLFYMTDSTWLIYALLSVVSTADIVTFFFFLPETKNQQLENHLPPPQERIFGKGKI